MTQEILELLKKYESRNVTYIDPAGGWPVAWKKAKGVYVWDLEGKKYLDLTAAFGVAAAGHAHPAIVKAGQRQMGRLPHAMGDVHPHPLKAELARELSRLTFERWSETRPQTGKTIFCNSGFEAVEAALKTAHLATGKPGIIAFEGAYHGLGYGTLNATHRDHFRGPFRNQLREFGYFLPFPESNDDLGRIETGMRKLVRRHSIGAVLAEPVQGRGGIRVPPGDFLPLLRRLCDDHEIPLIVDEIYTGFGRTGQWFACEHGGTIPDLICLGKALTGGFPLSACVGKAGIMDKAWPTSDGEAIHTSTFLGNPVGCAMSLAQIKTIENEKLVDRCAEAGRKLLDGLKEIVAQTSRIKCSARGLGLMAGLELRTSNGKPATKCSLKVVKEMLRRGFILLPEGEHANVISFTPPLMITPRQLSSALRTLAEVLQETS